jgi:methyltransferase|eukprot:g6746.t1
MSRYEGGSKEKRRRDDGGRKKYNPNKNRRHEFAPRSNDRSSSQHYNATDGAATEALWNQRPGGRKYTVSVAIPGSIVANAQSRELRTYLAGQVARTLAVFNVDEVIVFDDRSISKATSGGTAYGDANTFLARVLQYLECPQYLRKKLFPIHPDLQFAGLLNPLDAPHHMRADEIRPYREGVVVDALPNDRVGSLVHVGTRQYVQIPKRLKPGTRVTVEMGKTQDEDGGKRSFNGPVPKGRAVAPSKPRTSLGVYWGYSVRMASGFKEIFSQCPFEGGYDCAIGTSENGASIHGDPATSTPAFQMKANADHTLIVFGGLAGLEASVEADESLNVPKEKTKEIFDFYLNSCPNQGSRTIRTEEAILITLALLCPQIDQCARERTDIVP